MLRGSFWDPLGSTRDNELFLLLFLMNNAHIWHLFSIPPLMGVRKVLPCLAFWKTSSILACPPSARPRAHAPLYRWIGDESSMGVIQ
jgi:hypothetical protein